MRLRLRGAADEVSEALLPACSLSCVQFSEAESGWRVDLSVAPEVAGTLVRALGWPAADTPEDAVRRSWKPAGSGLAVVVEGDADEWLRFDEDAEGMAMTGTTLELLFFDPALDALSSVQQRAGEVSLTITPEQQQLAVEVPVTDTDISSLTAAGYRLAPVSAQAEEVVVGETHVGFLYKEIDASEGELNLLLGLQHTMAHPYLYRPFLPSWEVFDERRLERIVTETFLQDLQAGDLPEEFHGEFSGMTDEPLTMLVGVCLALASALHDDLFGEQGAPPELEWRERVTLLCVCSLLSGSRAARAEAAHQGHDTSLDRVLPAAEVEHLVNGLLSARDALRQASGGRSDRVWELPPRSACVVEAVLLEALRTAGDEQEGNLPLPGPDAIFAAMCLAFDLGVRYQTLRVASHLLGS